MRLYDIQGGWGRTMAALMGMKIRFRTTCGGHAASKSCLQLCPPLNATTQRTIKMYCLPPATFLLCHIGDAA